MTLSVMSLSLKLVVMVARAFPVKPVVPIFFSMDLFVGGLSRSLRV